MVRWCSLVQPGAFAPWCSGAVVQAPYKGAHQPAPGDCTRTRGQSRYTNAPAYSTPPPPPDKMPHPVLPRTPGARQCLFQRDLTSPPTATGRAMGASRS